MIVVDTNILAYLYLPTKFTASVETLIFKEPKWAAPSFWRSEFRNVLAQYFRKKIISFDDAIQIQAEAESLMAGNEFEVNSSDILTLVKRSACSAYDCEFVALASSLKVPLVTADKKIISEFPGVAFSLQQFLF